MNQDAFLERLWVEVIDDVERCAAPKGAGARDAKQLARMARYEALFAWCDAFDESGHRVAWWLARPSDHRCWRNLGGGWTPESVAYVSTTPPGAPFADAEAARARLLAKKVDAAALATFMKAQHSCALEGLRRILAEQAWRAGELSGLHESLLSADPSDLCAGPGSWPRRARAPGKAPRGSGPYCTVKKAHMLAFSPDGAEVVAAKGGAITALASGKARVKCAFLANTSHVAWSPDGAWIAGVSTSGEIAICRADTGVRARVLTQSSEGPAPHFLPDGHLVSGAWSGDVTLWDVARGKSVRRLHVPDAMVIGLALAPNGNVAVLARHTQGPVELIFFDASLRRHLGNVALPKGTDDVTVCPTTGRALVTGGHSAAWLGGGEPSPRFDTADVIRSGAISPDGRWVVLTLLRGFRVGPANDLSQGTEHALSFSNDAAFSKDGSLVALSTWSEGEVWAVETLMRARARRPRVDAQ